MKSAIKTYLVGTILAVGIGAQVPAPKKGVHVEMPVASHAVEMRAADEQNAVVVAITEYGKVFVGIQSAEPTALNRVSQRTVYVKADARAPYQIVLSVLDALHGKSVVLLSQSPEDRVKGEYIAPFGTKLIVAR